MTTVDATKVLGHTMVGYYPSAFPLRGRGGNCFDFAIDGEPVRILNFGLENLHELQRRGLTFPIKCVRLSKHHAVVCDGRIGERWYSDEFCPVCTPKQLLPLPQRIQQLCDVQAGIRTENEDFCSVDLQKKRQIP